MGIIPRQIYLEFTFKENRFKLFNFKLFSNSYHQKLLDTGFNNYIAITFMSNFKHATKRLERKIWCFRIITMVTCFCDQTIHTTAHTNNIPNCTMHSTDQLSLEDFNTGSIIYTKCFNSNFFKPVFPVTCSVSYSFVSNPKPSIKHGLIGKFKTRETFQSNHIFIVYLCSRNSIFIAFLTYNWICWAICLMMML